MKWPFLYDPLFNLEGLSYTHDPRNTITAKYGDMFCNAFPASMRNNSVEYPFYCKNMTGFTWNVTNETINMKKSLKEKALIGFNKL